MAMLAERRQRKRYNLVPKGKALFEDSDRFGTKMLEKMGWSKGKGLGSREDGQQEFIRVRYKNDANGLGFEDRDDQWTQHEKHFTGLLESLKGGDSTTSSISDDREESAPTVGLGFVSKTTTKERLKDKFSGQSLEEKSKTSKARVHYKKFTKGKDMSQYSEKDLANIFGKKAAENDINIYNQFQAINAGSEEKGEEKEGENKEEDVKNASIELGTQIINTGVSVSDYFKMKMAALKEKKGETVVNGTDNKEKIEEDVETEDSMKKKKSKKRQVEEVNEFAPVPEETTEEVSVKKKKNNKRSADEDNELLPVSKEVPEKVPGKQKKKKKQPADVEVNEFTPIPEEVVEKIPGKKKKSKMQGGEEDFVEFISKPDEGEGISPKDKKSKNEEINISPEEVVEEVPRQEKKKNKKLKTVVEIKELISTPEEIPRKGKKSKDDEINPAHEEVINEPPHQGKKSKKRAALLEVEEVSSTNQEAGEEISQKKKKRKNAEVISNDAEAIKEVFHQETTEGEKAIVANGKEEEFPSSPEEAVEEASQQNRKLKSKQSKIKKEKSIEEVPQEENKITLLTTNNDISLSSGELLSKKENQKPSVEDELNGSVVQKMMPSKKKKNKKSAVIVIDSDVEEDINKSGDESNTLVNIVENSSSDQKIFRNLLKKNKEEQKGDLSILKESISNEIPLKKNKTKKRPSPDFDPPEESTENRDTETVIPLKKNKSKASEQTSEASTLIPEKLTTNESSKEKNKKKNRNEETEDSENPIKKNPKKKNKTKQDPSQTTTLIEVSPQHNIKNLTDNCLLDTFTISTFCAEKFRNVELHQFHGSNVSEINGYGLSENLELNIKIIKNDQERIMRLWSGTLDKYQYSTPKHKIYNTYMTKAKEARRTKNKIPKIKVKSLKRKHVFQCL